MKKVDVGEGYRELGPDETVQVGDEFWLEHPGKWEESGNAGLKAGDCEEFTYRRKIEEPAEVTSHEPVLVWEVGKEYKTRDGRRFRVYATDGKGAFSVHGAILDDGDWVAQSRTADGHYLSNGKPFQSDLMPPVTFGVGEWVTESGTEAVVTEEFEGELFGRFRGSMGDWNAGQWGAADGVALSASGHFNLKERRVTDE